MSRPQAKAKVEGAIPQLLLPAAANASTLALFLRLPLSMAPTRRQRHGWRGPHGGKRERDSSTCSQFRAALKMHEMNEYPVCVCMYVWVHECVWEAQTNCGESSQNEPAVAAAVAVAAKERRRRHQKKLTSKCIKQKLSTIFQSPSQPCPIPFSLTHSRRRLHPWTVAVASRRDGVKSAWINSYGKLREATDGR